MSVTSSAAIKRAIVAQLRTNTDLKTALSGGIHEGFAPKKAPYPLLVYNMVYSPYDYLWDSVIIVGGFDINIWSYSSVDANNIDALVLSTLNDAHLSTEGQTTLICRRTADLGSQDVDEEGRKLYMVGGTYEVWTDQNL